MEADEAGRLRAFREKFGRGWDASKAAEKDLEGAEVEEGGEEEVGVGDDNLMDLISGFGQEGEGRAQATEVKEGKKKKSGKGKGGGK